MGEGNWWPGLDELDGLGELLGSVLVLLAFALVLGTVAAIALIASGWQ